jgi:hypothetical protein
MPKPPVMSEIDGEFELSTQGTLDETVDFFDPDTHYHLFVDFSPMQVLMQSAVQTPIVRGECIHYPTLQKNVCQGSRDGNDVKWPLDHSYCAENLS